MSNIPQLDFERVNLLIELALAEDLADAGDTTSKSVIPADARARGVLYAKSDCVIAGLPVAEAVFKNLIRIVNLYICSATATNAPPKLLLQKSPATPWQCSLPNAPH